MNHTKITEDFSVGPQPSLDDIKNLSALGFKALMVNRPEGEEPGQPTHDQERDAASQAGVEAAFVPLVPGQLTPAIIDSFRAEYESLPKPIFAHCKAGPRSVMLWALSQKGQRPDEEIQRLAGQAGVDVSRLLGM